LAGGGRKEGGRRVDFWLIRFKQNQYLLSFSDWGNREKKKKKKEGKEKISKRGEQKWKKRKNPSTEFKS